MATIYLRSTDGNDADDGSTWALAKATLAAALTAAGAGGTVYVSDNHAETQASAMTLTSPGTAASPTLVLCVDDSAEPPTALATTGTVSTTGANSITFAGVAYVYGLTFTAGDGANSASLNWTSASNTFFRLEACVAKLGNTNAASRINTGASGNGATQLLEWVGTQAQFGSTSQAIQIRGNFVWRNTSSAIQGSVPTTLFQPLSGPAMCEIRAVDLSALASGTSILNAGSSDKLLRIDLIDCKLGSSVTLVANSITGQGGITFRAVNCDSADTNYRYHKQAYQGTITQESTIVRTGGASDGTTPISRKMVSTANSKFYSPLESDEIIAWNETLGSITATVEIVTDNVTLTDDECWLEVEYLGTSGFPIASRITDAKADILATGANQTSSSETWTTTGLATPVKQKLSVTFTPAEKGLIRARVMLAKASTTVYVDPQLQLQSGRTYQAGPLYLNEPATGGATGIAALVGGSLTR